MFKLKILILLLLSISYEFISAQQIDTVLVNNSITPYKVVSTRDTIMLNKYLKENVLKMNLYSIETGDLMQEIKDTVDEYYSLTGIYYYDINLDDYKDINIRYEYMNGMKENSFWLYDSVSKSFKYASDFSMIDENYLIEDEKEKIIRTYDPWYPGIVCASEYLYKIEGTRLKLIEEEGCGNFDLINYYFYKKKVVNEEVRIVELDSLILTNNKYLRKSYNFIQDTLLLSRIYWTYGNEESLDDSSNYKICFESEFTGPLRCYKKEMYNYSTNDKGNLEYSIQEFIVKNNSWIQIK